jgi:copper(I)-binding protein
MQVSSKTLDRLLFASSDLADKAEVHEMKIIDGVMKMRPLATGLELAPNQNVKLVPGSFHIMLFGIKQALKEGDQFPLTLTFAKAGKITVNVKVQAMTELSADTPTHSHN